MKETKLKTVSVHGEEKMTEKCKSPKISVRAVFLFNFFHHAFHDVDKRSEIERKWCSQMAVWVQRYPLSVLLAYDDEHSKMIYGVSPIFFQLYWNNNKAIDTFLGQIVSKNTWRSYLYLCHVLTSEGPVNLQFTRIQQRKINIFSEIMR